MFNIFNIFRKSKSVTTSKPMILRGSFVDGVITLIHNDIVVCQGDIHVFNQFLRANKIPRDRIIWGEYDSIKESYWKSRYN